MYLVSKKAGRLDYIDMARGLGMLSIIIGHMGSSVVSDIVFTYHVPLFFLISGFFYKDKIETVKKYVCRLLKPYFITWILLIVLCTIKAGVKAIANSEEVGGVITYSIKYWLVAGLYGGGSTYANSFWGYNDIPIIGATWFFIALLWAIILLFLIEKLDIKTWSKTLLRVIKTCIVGVVFFVGWFSAKYSWWPLSIQAGCTGLGFLYIGYMYRLWKLDHKREEEYNKSKRSQWTIAIIAILLWLQSIVRAVNVEDDTSMSLVRNWFSNPILDIVGAVSVSWLIMQGMTKIDENCKKSAALRLIKRMLVFFGVYSDIILCIHLIDMNILPWDKIYSYVPYYTIAFILIFIFKLSLYYGVTKIITRRKCIFHKFYLG